MNMFLPSRTGAMFGAVVTDETDGSLSILSNDGKGYRSAHRKEATKRLGRVKCLSRLTWLNLDGVRVVSTLWGGAK